MAPTLVHLEPVQVSFRFFPVGAVLIVLPKRGVATNLGGLVGPGRVFRLDWESPEAAIELLVSNVLRGYSAPIRA